MKMSIKKAALIIATAILPFTGCKKAAETTGLSSDDQTAALDQAQLEKTSNDVENISDNAGTTGTVNMRLAPSELGSCAVITFDTSSGTHTITIDFGTGCTDIYGNTRAGKIIISFSGHYRDSGSTHTITYSNYYFNGNKLNGSKSVTNIGSYTFSVIVNDSLTLTDGSVISWTGNRTRVWTNGYSTATIWDDEYNIYGTTTVSRSSTGKSTTFVVSSSTPLHVATICKWVESGIITATRSTGGSYSIDYGSTGCDNDATLTVGGKTYSIKLR